MVAPRGAAPAIVICTGHGPVSLADNAAGSADHRTGKAAHPGVCPFAGHGLAGAPPLLAGTDAALVSPSPANVAIEGKAGQLVATALVKVQMAYSF